jgi:hypothetical protein
MVSELLVALALMALLLDDSRSGFDGGVPLE